MFFYLKKKFLPRLPKHIHINMRNMQKSQKKKRYKKINKVRLLANFPGPAFLYFPTKNLNESTNKLLNY